MVELEALASDKPKYEVRKVEDGTVVEDAVVIRLKDPFAVTALFTYANTIMSFLELMGNNESISDEEHTRMLEIADYFHERATESQAIAGKRLPD